MSLSDTPKMKPKQIKAFQFPRLGDEEGGFLPKIESFEFQAFGGITAAQVSFSEAELTDKAEEILVEAEQKRRDIERQAYEEGFRQGQKDGQEVGRRGLEEVIQRFDNIVEALVQEKEALLHRRERELVELVLQVSHTILARELFLQPEVIRDLVALGFQLALEDELHINPQDYEIVAEASRDSWPPGVELISDGTITPGGFRLESDRGDLDGTLEARWARVREAIQESLEEPHEVPTPS